MWIDCYYLIYLNYLYTYVFSLDPVCMITDGVGGWMKGLCLPGGHYWDYYPGALSYSGITSMIWRSGILRFLQRMYDLQASCCDLHDDVIKWKYSPRYRPFVRGIHRLPVNSPHKGLWRGALFFSLICAWINGWVNNRKAGDLRRHRAHYDVTVMDYMTTEIATGRHNLLLWGGGGFFY